MFKYCKFFVSVSVMHWELEKKQINCPHAVIIAFIGLDVQTHPQAFIFCQ